METATKRKVNRRTRVKIQVSFFLGSLILIGFVLGFVVGRATAPKVEEQIVTETEATTELETEPISTPPEQVTVVIVPPAAEHENHLYAVPLEDAVQSYIFQCCTLDNVSTDLVIAVIDKESDFKEDVISVTGDYGLMQINEGNHEWLEEMYGVSDFLDPYENIYCGVKLLSYYLERYGDLHKALMAYNMGEGNAQALWDKGITTSEYSRSVVAIMEEIENGTRYETR